MSHLFRAFWKLGKYFLGILIGAYISLSLVQRKFPPNVTGFSKLQDIRREVASESQGGGETHHDKTRPDYRKSTVYGVDSSDDPEMQNARNKLRVLHQAQQGGLKEKPAQTNTDDPFEEALALHEKQRETWKKIDEAVNGDANAGGSVNRGAAAVAPPSTLPSNMKTFKTQQVQQKSGAPAGNQNISY